MAQLKVIIRDHTGATMTPVELPDDVPMRRLIPALITKMNLPTRQGGQPLTYALDNMQTGRRLRDDDTMLSAGVKADDILTLLPGVTAGGGVPIRTFRDIQLIEGVLNNSSLIDSADGVVLFAVLLYTDEDKSVASYIREDIRELQEMSGHQCLFFVIEKPSSEWEVDIRRYLGTLTHKYFDAVWDRLGVDSFKPFDKSQAYEIARRFGAKPNQLPCIVFFSSLKGQDALVVEMNSFVDTPRATTVEISHFFRMLFSYAEESMSSGLDNSLKDLSRRLAKEERERKKASTDKTEMVRLGSTLIEAIGSVIKLFLP